MDNRSPEVKETAQHRKAEVLRLRRRGQSFAVIGAELGVTAQRAHQIYTRALAEIPAEEVALYRAEQAERLDGLLRAAYEVLDRTHPLVSHGRVIRAGRPYVDDDGEAVVDERGGEPLEDAGPKLAAIAAILRIEERRAKLLGLDAPVVQKVAGDLTVTYSFEGVDLEGLK